MKELSALDLDLGDTYFGGKLPVLINAMLVPAIFKDPRTEKNRLEQDTICTRSVENLKEKIRVGMFPPNFPALRAWAVGNQHQHLNSQHTFTPHEP
jgi:hypothetical protein